MGKTTKTVILDLDKKRKFKLDLNAMINFEEESGKSLINMKPDDEFSLKDIRAMLWAGINSTIEKEELKLSLEEVGSFVHPGNMAEVSNKIMEVYENSVPEGDSSKGESKGKNGNRSTG